MGTQNVYDLSGDLLETVNGKICILYKHNL